MTTVSLDISPVACGCEGVAELSLLGKSDLAPHNLQRQVRVLHARPFQPLDPLLGPESGLWPVSLHAIPT